MTSLEFRLDGRSESEFDEDTKEGEKRSRDVAHSIARAVEYFGNYKVDIEWDYKHGQGVIKEKITEKGDAVLTFTNNLESFKSRVEFQTAPDLLRGGIVNPISNDEFHLKLSVAKRCLRDNIPAIGSYLKRGLRYGLNVDLDFLVLLPERIRSIVSRRTDCGVGTNPAFRIRRSINSSSIFTLPCDLSKITPEDQRKFEQAIENLKFYGLGLLDNGI